MSDARLRDAERRFQDTGSVDDEARLLRERVRAGELPRRHAELAARLGDRAARLVFPDLRLVEVPTPRDLSVLLVQEGGSRPGWIAALQLRGRLVFFRFVVAALRAGKRPLRWHEALELALLAPPPEGPGDATLHDDARRLVHLTTDVQAAHHAGRALLDHLRTARALRRGFAGASVELSDWLVGRRDALRERAGDTPAAVTRPGAS